MIIGLSGYAQSGKDTVAQILVEHYGFERVAFADKIREFCYAMNPVVGHVANEETILRHVVDRDGWDEAKQVGGIRRMLQNVGIAAREVFGEKFWIEQALTGINPTENIVITDVRFTNEARAIKEYESSQIWRIKRLGVQAVNSHVSESEMDDYAVDQIFLNNGTIEDLKVLVQTRMRGYDL